MPLKARLFLLLLSLGMFVFILQLIRGRRLKIEHSILWLTVSVLMIILSVWQGFTDQIARAIGIDYPPALYFAIAIVFAFLMLLHLSMELSKMKDRIKTLNQELSISELYIQELKQKQHENTEINEGN
ncbi:MAG: DUF2304 domain-containing protein [Calditrichaeota bacterium]|nr:DUF2304 domain-containing protein [Calditrichota bacterium]